MSTTTDSTRTVVVNVVAVGVSTTSTANGQELAATGGPWSTWTGAGLTMIIAGFLMIRFARRRVGAHR